MRFCLTLTVWGATACAAGAAPELTAPADARAGTAGADAGAAPTGGRVHGGSTSTDFSGGGGSTKPEVALGGHGSAGNGGLGPAGNGGLPPIDHAGGGGQTGPVRVLVYCAFASNHWDDSCAAGRYLAGLGPSHGFEVDLADQLGDFANKDLASYDAVVFAGTLRDVLTSTEESQLQQYVEAGGSFVGLYQAANTETQWPFYVNELLSGAAATKGHCHDGAADVTVQAAEHPALAGVPRSFRTHAKGWYAFDRPPSGVTVLMTASGPTTAKGFEMVDSPIAFARTGSFGGRIAFSMLAPPQDVVELDWFSRHFAALIVWAASG